ncbi:hypothetical protein [Chitinophaga sp. CB10]|uniref:hypothetical protein n=1 Tax=Chitinophaga sp. CB10 TaxID=1891659 RepID=UPI0025BA7C99|nr:hypothetical protein [Chitinophaga sp. CB10]
MWSWLSRTSIPAQFGSESGIGSRAPVAAFTAVRPLYNANIAAMSVNLLKVGESLVFNYSYDVLNRIRNMDVAKSLGAAANRWMPINTGDFNESITYDGSGNIQTYNRNGHQSALDRDKLTYNYLPGTNKLSHINDAVPATA